MTSGSELRCGPAGWSHPAWEKSVHPWPRPRNFHSLRFLAEHFDTVEISRTFTEMPRPEHARLWARQVQGNKQFQFTAKLHRQFTHDRNLDADDVRTFCQGLRPLKTAGRFGCLLMQFPWSFRLTEENRAFLISLRRAFHEFPLAAELRHDSWLRDEGVGTLIDHRIGFCNIDQPHYIRATPATTILTTGIAMVRLHGRDCKRWYARFDEGTTPAHRYDYQYTTAELMEWEGRINKLRQHAAQTFIVFNNDAGDKSVLNALQMQQQLGVKPLIPAGLQQQFALFWDLPSRKAPSQAPLFGEYAVA